MNFGQLKTQVLDYADRTDLSSQVASFVSLAEGLIRRDLRASVYTVTLAEADRVADGVYTLPSTLLEVRVIRVDDEPLEQKSLAEIRSSRDTTVKWYAVNGDTVEFRGVPDTDTEIELTYFGYPAPLSDDTDENELLTSHEALYLYGSLFHLYQYVQDTELANGALETFQDALTKLNEAMGRKLGGAAMRGVYHFGPIYRGY